MDTLHSPTIHVSKKEKQKRKEALEQKILANDNGRSKRFWDKYGGLLGKCHVEGEGDQLRVSFWCDDEEEAALLLPKLNQLINDNKRDLRKQQQTVKTYQDVYDSVAPE